MESKASLWSKPRWAKGVYVVQESVSGPVRRKPLHVALLQMTARACAICDRYGRHPFASDKLLQVHALFRMHFNWRLVLPAFAKV